MNGSFSVDVDGEIISYEWKDGDTLLSSDANFEKSDFIAGTYNYSCDVKPVYLMSETKPSNVSFGEKVVSINFEIDNPTGYYIRAAYCPVCLCTGHRRAYAYSSCLHVNYSWVFHCDEPYPDLGCGPFCTGQGNAGKII